MTDLIFELSLQNMLRGCIQWEKNAKWGKNAKPGTTAKVFMHL